MSSQKLDESVIAVIGLGNIGLPLAIEFGKKYATIGFDLDDERILSLNQDVDSRNYNSPFFSKPEKLSFSNDIDSLKLCNIYIIAVQTSSHADGKPNLYSLINASKSIAYLLKKDDLVIYEL